MSQSHHHHHHHHRSRRKKQKMKNRALIILGVVLLVIAIPLTAGIITFNHYLSKVNYEEETKEIPSSPRTSPTPRRTRIYPKI